jgi:hypothetical protein
VINVLVLQNSKDLLKGEVGSSSMMCGTSTLHRNEVNGTEAERVLDITEEDQDPTTITVIKTEPSVSCVPVVSVTHISCRLYPELPARISVCPCKVVKLSDVFLYD